MSTFKSRINQQPSGNRFLIQLRNLVLPLAVLLFSATSHAATTVTYYHNDALGSPVAATDATGTVIWREQYRPFGETIRNEVAADNNSRSFTGHVKDKETGLLYMGARFYDPQLGRFMAIDPQGFKESNPTTFNRYAYANNNPYKYVDPDGEAASVITAEAGFLGGTFVCGPVCGLIGGAIGFGTGIYISYKVPSLIFNDSDDDQQKTERDAKSREGQGDQKAPQKGKRATSRDDALDRLEEMEKAQRRVRQGKSGQIIDDISKSRQRAKDSLKPQNIDLDDIEK